MNHDPAERDDRDAQDAAQPDREVCPVCGAPLLHEKCKVICRSATCVYRIVYNCAEF